MMMTVLLLKMGFLLFASGHRSGPTAPWTPILLIPALLFQLQQITFHRIILLIFLVLFFV